MTKSMRGSLKVRERIIAALDELELLIKESEGRLNFRLSINEVCRRSSVDKNTLRAPYYGDLRKRADRLVAFAAITKPIKETPSNISDKENVAILAQKLIAAEILRDQALEYAEKLNTELLDAKQQLADMGTSANVLPFK